LQEFFPDQIVKGGAFPVLGQDRNRSVALLAPDFFEFHHDR
jgi:hypothetical protein